MFAASDYDYMARALRLAARGLYTTDPNPRVGCVLVKDGLVVGEGWHERAGQAHAEVMALAMAGARARGASAYVSLEPCCHHGKTPPCTAALIAAGVQRVVAAMVDPNPQVAGQGLAHLESAGIATASGLLASEAAALNPGFIQRMRQGRPWVRCKLAMSLDGRTALANGTSQWITSEAARSDVHEWRARSSAIMTGIGTVMADNPRLDVRIKPAVVEGSLRQPLRVVLDSDLRIAASARVLQPAEQCLVFCGRDTKMRTDLSPQLAVRRVTRHEHGLNLEEVMRELEALHINEVWVEAGARLSGALLQAGLIDELIVYMAPMLMGDQARGLLTLPVWQSLSDCPRLEIKDMRAVGQDWRIIAVPQSRG